MTSSILEMSGQAYSHQICKKPFERTIPQSLIYSCTLRCLEHCSSLCRTYYGLIWGDQCVCGSDQPADEHMREESHCNLACVGDSSAACGGPLNAVNVYEVDDGCATTATTATTATEYQCHETYISNDCRREYDNAVRNGNLEHFYHRCATEGGARPLRTRCALCCGQGEHKIALESSMQFVMFLIVPHVSKIFPRGRAQLG